MKLRGRIVELVDWKRSARGQGMVEFALILPFLLLVLMGIIDFGHALFVYTNIFSAAREGGRFGAVQPLNPWAIASQVRRHIYASDPSQVDVWVWYDHGPGTGPFTDPAAVKVGDRVVVRVAYEVPLITPMMLAFAEGLPVDIYAARTIVSLGQGVPDAPPPAPPTPTPEGGGDSDGPGLDEEPAATSTPTPTPTPTVIVPIEIAEPLWEGDIRVAGTAQPGATISLRDIYDPSLQLTTVVQEDGTFTFNLPSPLIAGHLIVVQGYGEQDFAVVQGESVTPTPTPAATPTPTPTPTTPYIVISPTCGLDGEAVTILVEGYNWPGGQGKKITVEWDGETKKANINPARDGRFSTSFTVVPTAGEHTVSAENGRGDVDTALFVAPCVPDMPNLLFSTVTGPADPVPAGSPVEIRVVVHNGGTQPVGSFFWVDLYADPADPENLQGETSVAWGVVSSLAAGESVTMVLTYEEGFAVEGDHTFYALADTWDQVTESDEGDNVGSTAVTISGQVTPTPTPTPADGTGSISGETWLFMEGYTVPQGRVDVYAYDAVTGMLVAQTVSDDEGFYTLVGLPPGTYDVVGELIVDGQLYWDMVGSVQVAAGEAVGNVLLVLH